MKETFYYTAVALHELYSGHLGTFRETFEGFNKKVEEDFGPWNACVLEIPAVGIAISGKALLGHDIFSSRLVVNGVDAHNVYNYTWLIPLIVLDTYKHAYYVDQNNKRPPYIDAFLQNLNWKVINDRYEKTIKAYEALMDFIK